MDVYSRSGRIGLAKRLGGGGEADVYEVIGASRAAKLYRSTISPADLGQKQLKVQAMIDMTPVDPGARIGHVSLAWPTEPLFDSSRRFCGYLMPRIEKAQTLSIMSNPKGRQIASVPFDWRYLHRTAANLATSVGAVHRIGHCIGDFNPGNVLITNQALITLIDTDSFQIIDRRRQMFRCGVGIDQYLAPERTRGGTVTVEQDSFVLAVLIFQLLMGGFHPFDGGAIIAAYSTAQLPLAQYLKQGVFPFIANGQAQPPDGAPDFGLLRRELRDAFQRTFITGHAIPTRRVMVSEWVDLVGRAEADLVQCSRERKHLYYKSVGTCIWCEQQRRTRTQVPLPPPPAVHPQPRRVTPAAPPMPTVTPHAQRLRTAGAAVARRVDPRYLGVIALIVVIGAVSSRSVLRQEPVTPDTAATDTTLTYTETIIATDATDTMATDTSATTATATADVLLTTGAVVEDVRLFASPSPTLPEPRDRQFVTSFDRAATQHLAWQLELTNPNPPEVRLPFVVDARFVDAQGAVVATQQLETLLEPQWPASWHSKGVLDASTWPAGEYRLELTIGGRTLGIRTFELVDRPTGFSQLNAQVTALNLFVSSSTQTPYKERRYVDRLDSSTLTWLGWELNLSRAATDARVPFAVEVVVWHDGSVLARETENFYVEPSWTRSYHDSRINAAAWTAGTYTIQVISDGNIIAAKEFALD